MLGGRFATQGHGNGAFCNASQIIGGWGKTGDAASFSSKNQFGNFIDLMRLSPLTSRKKMRAHFLLQVASRAAVILAALLAIGCRENQEQVGWWQGEQQRIELTHQLELKKFRFEQAYSRDFEQLEALRKSAQQTASALKSLRGQRTTLGGEVEMLEGQWAGFRDSMIRGQRQQAMGKTFEKFTSVTGRTFAAVTVAAIDDSGVTIRHADGSARLRYSDLDGGQRVFFGLEADLALAAEEKEAQDSADYERWVQTRMVAIDERKQRDSEIARREDLANQRTRAALAAQVASASATRPLARPATNVGDRSWSYSNSYSNYRSYRPTYRYVYYNTTPSYYCPPAFTVYPKRPAARNVYTPSTVRGHKSFANTTLPYIP